MRRREVVVLLSQAAAFLPLTARSQQANRLPTIGFLAPDKQTWSSLIAAFENGLRKLGWIQGRTVAIEYRWSQGRPERVAEFSTEFVQQKVDVIVTYGGAVAIVKESTTSIPIVFAIVADALASGIVTISRIRAVTSQYSRTSRPKLPPNGSNCSVKLFLKCAG